MISAYQGYITACNASQAKQLPAAAVAAGSVGVNKQEKQTVAISCFHFTHLHNFTACLKA